MTYEQLTPSLGLTPEAASISHFLVLTTSNRGERPDASSQEFKSAFGFKRVKVLALSVIDVGRADRFYRETLGLPMAFEGDEHVGYFLGDTILMLKPEWYAPPTELLNPRVTIATEHAPDTEAKLRAAGVTISDDVRAYDAFYVGSFLDSEGNKLWFCSPVDQ